MAKRPSVKTKCLADNYHGAGERIVEFSSANGGGLISFSLTDDGKLLVQVYRQDATVEVTVGPPENGATA